MGSASAEHLTADEIDEFQVEDEEDETEDKVDVVEGADCVWDGTGDDVDELSMNQLCSLYTESECISSQNGKSKGRCQWRGKMHSKTSKFHTNVDDNRNGMVDGFSVSK